MQSRPGPNGSLDRLMITGMMIGGLGIPGVGRAAGADSRSRTSWQRWLWPGGIQRLGAGAFPASRLTLMTELDSELGSFNLNLKFKFKLPKCHRDGPVSDSDGLGRDTSGFTASHSGLKA